MMKKKPLTLTENIAISSVPPISGDVIQHDSRVRMKALSYEQNVDVITEEIRKKIIGALHNINQPLSVIYTNIEYMSAFSPDGTFDQCYEVIKTMIKAQSDRMACIRSDTSGSSLDAIKELSSIMYRQLILLPPLLHFAHDAMIIKNPEGAYDDTCEAVNRLSLDIHRFSALCFEGRNETKSQRFDVLEMVQSLVKGSRLGNIVTYQPNAPIYIYADKRDIEQVIENLLSNAYKYGQNASIVITPIDHAVRIEVRDEGPGIPEDDEDLFEMFTRGKVSPMTEGYGVGLAFCKSVVTEAGGNLSAQNIYDQHHGYVKGACFSVELPTVV